MRRWAWILLAVCAYGLTSMASRNPAVLLMLAPIFAVAFTSEVIWQKKFKKHYNKPKRSLAAIGLRFFAEICLFFFLVGLSGSFNPHEPQAIFARQLALGAFTLGLISFSMGYLLSE